MMAQSTIMADCGVTLFGFETQGIYVTKREAKFTIDDMSRPWIMNCPSSLELEARFVLNSEQARSLMDSTYALGAVTISRLGDTQICQCCNYNLRPGAMSCHRCGSPYTVTVKKSRHDRIGRAYFQGIDFADIWGGYTGVNLNFSMADLTFYGTDARRTFNGWCTTHLEDGWICWYCKSVNDMNKTECHYCGCGRLPFSDLERIAQKCLYCGTKLTKGAVCTGCGSAQNDYSVWPPRYDW